MAALPTTTTAFSTGATESDFKTFISGQRNYLAGLFGEDGTVETAKATLGAVSGVTSINGRGGDVSLVSSDITGPLGFTPLSIDPGAGAIGSICLGRPNNTTNNGQTISASYLSVQYFNGTVLTAMGGVFSGTWRNISGGQLAASTMTGLFQRIA